jgi:BNR repeat-like domain
MRRFALLFALVVTATVGAGAASAAVGPLSLATGPSPFAPGCNGAPQTGTNYLNAEVEPWVDANPLNPRNLIAVWQQDRWSNGGANGLLTGVSENGGRTWTRPTPPTFTFCEGGTAANGGDYERASDPWVSFSPNGDAYQISLSFNDSNPTSAVLVSKSENNGRTWGPVTTLIKDTDPQFFNDKESITADPTDSRFAYAVWDRLDQVPNDPNAPFFGPATFSRTTDGGQTWSKPKIIFDPGANNQTIGNQIVVLPDGTLIDEFDLINQGVPTVALIRSTDKGETWSDPIVVDLMLGTALFANGVVDPSDGHPVRTGDILPDIAVDPRAGTSNLYIVWQDARFTQFDRDQIVLASSSDGGLTWTDPKRVSENKATQAFTASVHVRENGHIAVNYYDFTNDDPSGGTLDTDYWATASRNGGATFTPRERVTPNPFDMRTAPDAGGFFVGDYEGLTSANRIFYPFFVQANTGNLANRTDGFSTTYRPSFGGSAFAPEALTLGAERKAQSAAPDGAFSGALLRH